MSCLHYDMDWDDTAPKPNEYLVSIRKDASIGSVWQIAAVRKVQHKSVREYQCYVIEKVPAQDQKAFTVYDPETHEVWVRGEAAHPLIWYPRKKK